MPGREEARRREYKSTVLALLIVAPAAIGFKFWSQSIGMTALQFRGTMLAFLGLALLIMGLVQPAPLRYPRSYLIVPAVPLVVVGIIIPLAPAAYVHGLIGLMGLAAVGLAAFIMHRHVRRCAADRGDREGH